MLIRPASPLFAYLREKAAFETQRLMDIGLYDPLREGPNVEKIEPLLKPFLEKGEQARIPDEKLEWTVQVAGSTGPAFQGMGNFDIASLWYQIGQYRWLGKAHFSEVDVLTLDLPHREAPASAQASSAICAALVTNTSRAQDLFTWAAQNWAMTDLELEEQEKLRNYQWIWQNTGFRVFALSWLGKRWEEVHKLSEIGRRMVEKTRKGGFPKDFREPQLLIEIGWQLSSYFLDPNEETKQLAVDSLNLNKLPDRDAHTRQGMLPYLFALAHRYPELTPYSEADFGTRLWRPSAAQRATPPTRDEFQAALEEIFGEARKKKKWYVRVSAGDLHLRVGGYPSPDHRMDLCCAVMRENMKGREGVQGKDATLSINYHVPGMP